MAQDPLPRKLSAILHADVAGYSRLTGADEEGTHRRVSQYLDTMTAMTKNYHGSVLNYAGDAMLADFPTASDAIACALAIQQDLKQRNATLDDAQKIQFRIGVNLGEVIVDRGEIFGDGVNVAARLEGLAEPGGICISGAVYDAIGNKLSLDHQFLGEQSVKNIARPVRAYHVKLREGAELPQPRRASSPEQTHRFRLLRLIVVALGLCLMITVAWYLLASRRPSVEPAVNLPSSERPAIAVLPFSNLNNDAQQEYFADGITNDIITDLSKFESLFVIASNSVFAYKGKLVNVQNLNRELGVRYALVGSVQRESDKIRVNAQLIDTATSRHLWAKRYEREIKDLFAVQDELVRSIVGALAVKVREVEHGRVMRKDTSSLEAYDYVLRGRDYLSRVTRSSNLAARKMFQRAIQLDPNYAAAYVGLGWTYRRAVGHGWTEFIEQALEHSHELAQEAVRLGETAAGHGLLGSIYLVRGQYELANLAARRAIELNPNDSESLDILASVALYTGRTDEAVGAFEAKLRFDPNTNADTLFTLGLAYYLQAKLDKAIAVLERGISKNPDHLFIHAALAAAYAQAERPKEAAKEAATVRRLFPFFEAASFGSRFTNPADRERLTEGLRKAGLN